MSVIEDLDGVEEWVGREDNSGLVGDRGRESGDFGVAADIHREASVVADLDGCS